MKNVEDMTDEELRENLAYLKMLNLGLKYGNPINLGEVELETLGFESSVREEIIRREKKFNEYLNCFEVTVSEKQIYFVPFKPCDILGIQVNTNFSLEEEITLFSLSKENTASFPYSSFYHLIKMYGWIQKGEPSKDVVERILLEFEKLTRKKIIDSRSVDGRTNYITEDGEQYSLKGMYDSLKYEKFGWGK